MQVMSIMLSNTMCAVESAAIRIRSKVNPRAAKLTARSMVITFSCLMYALGDEV
jgi:hypothetical protein